MFLVRVSLRRFGRAGHALERLRSFETLVSPTILEGLNLFPKPMGVHGPVFGLIYTLPMSFCRHALLQIILQHQF